MRGPVTVPDPTDCGTGNAECGMAVRVWLRERPLPAIPHSALRTPHSLPLRIKRPVSNARSDLLDVGGERPVALECGRHLPHGVVRTPHTLPGPERFQEFEPLSRREQ